MALELRVSDELKFCDDVDDCRERVTVPVGSTVAAHTEYDNPEPPFESLQDTDLLQVEWYNLSQQSHL